MPRRTNNSSKEWAKLSDESLAAIIAHDYELHPSEFAIHCVQEPEQDFARNTSARGIDPMKKWL